MSSTTTQLIHHPYQPPNEFAAPQPGVFKASTVVFPNVAAMRTREWKDKSAYTYGLHGTPTTYTLEERLCTLEGGRYCVLLPSGLAAIANVALALLGTGDSMLLPDNVYGPNQALADGELARWGIHTQVYNPMDPADLAAKITERTRLVWVEAAGSVTLEFPDLPALVRICQARGVACALDNTWGAGLAFNPFDLLPGTSPALGVDISVHALTKYPSGGGDVLMGSAITRDPALHRKIQRTHMHLGLGVAGNEAELVLRSLPSMALRYRAHDAATRSLARWCIQRPEFAQVLHPSLSDAPGHAHWQALCGPADAAAGLFSVVLDARYTTAQVDAFCDALQLFKLGYSWGGPMSLVVPYDLARMRKPWPAHLAQGTLVRFAVGLEAVADLQADLAQALLQLAPSC
ncbi:cystathionine beta-lyase [Rhodoferax ferrireducens]|uniref:Cystathionine beta-lyase n=1 Tax=Rhodoferax ferrireducens TaxID=192843 RepID=A0ABU2C625_9BURK|nr:PLP-dependent transferase [Rhodoferax ferrireducens]MDR7376793.1 cystathionine beta-lyase [Rhodoferax ferrireducens]